MANVLNFEGDYGSDVRPPRSGEGSRRPWAKDPSRPGATDGTRLDATLVNDLIALFRFALDNFGVDADPGDDTALARLMVAGISDRAPLDSPEFVGAPTAPDVTNGDNSNKIANTAFVASAIAVAIAGLINAAPGALDTLSELADALGDDPNFSTTVTNLLAGKVSGPGSATNTALMRYDGADGKKAKNSGVLLSDSGIMTLPPTGAMQFNDGVSFAGDLNAIPTNIGFQSLMLSSPITNGFPGAGSASYLLSFGNSGNFGIQIGATLSGRLAQRGKSSGVWGAWNEFWSTSNFTLDTDTTLAANSDLRVATQKAIKAYIDAAIYLMDGKQSCRCMTTANVSLSGGGIANGTTHDGVTVSTGERICVGNQTSAAENGIYIVPASGAASRALDMDSWSEVPGALVAIEDGATNGGFAFLCTSKQGGTLGTTAISWITAISPTSGVSSLAGLTGIISAAAARSALSLVVGTNVQAYDVATLKSNATATLTAGYDVTSNGIGTIATGTVKPAIQTRGVQHYTNNGAHTLAPDTKSGSVVVDITNGASAGAITTSGFTKVTGDSFTTTNGNSFRCYITIGNAGSHLHIQAMQ